MEFIGEREMSEETEIQSKLDQMTLMSHLYSNPVVDERTWKLRERAAQFYTEAYEWLLSRGIHPRFNPTEKWYIGVREHATIR